MMKSLSVIFAFAFLTSFACSRQNRNIIEIPSGWDYLEYELQFKNTYTDINQQNLHDSYLRCTKTNEKIFMISEGYFVHRAMVVDLPMVEVSDGVLKLRAATNSNEFPVPDSARFGGAVLTGVHYGPQEQIIHSFTPPVRIEIRFQPAFVPGNFIALWMMSTEWIDGPDDIQMMQEFDLIEAGGHYDEGDGRDGKHLITSAVHSWHRSIKRGQSHRSGQRNLRTVFDFGSAGTWHTAIFEWLTGDTDDEKVIRYLINDELIFEVTPVDFNTPYLLNERVPASGPYTWAEIISQVWDAPMNLKLWNGIQPSNRFLGYDEVDPQDYPMDIAFEYIRTFRKNNHE